MRVVVDAAQRLRYPDPAEHVDVVPARGTIGGLVVHQQRLHDLVADTGAGRIEVNSILCSKNFHAAVFSEVRFLGVLNVVISREDGTPRDMAQALLKVRLDHVTAIVDRVLTTLDRNPELVKSLGHAVEDVGSGAGQTFE